MSNHSSDPIDTVTSGRNEGMQTRASGPLGEVEHSPESAPFPCVGDRLGILVMKPSRRVKTSFEYFQQLLFSALFQPIFCRKWVSPKETALSPLGQAHGTHWHQKKLMGNVGWQWMWIWGALMGNNLKRKNWGRKGGAREKKREKNKEEKKGALIPNGHMLNGLDRIRTKAALVRHLSCLTCS